VQYTRCERVHPRKSITTTTTTTTSTSQRIHHPYESSFSLLNTTSSTSRDCIYTYTHTYTMLTERELQISPIVQESVQHNTKVRPVRVAFASHHQHQHLPPSSHLTSAVQTCLSCHVALPCGRPHLLHFPSTYYPVHLLSPPTPRLFSISAACSAFLLIPLPLLIPHRPSPGLCLL